MDYKVKECRKNISVTTRRPKTLLVFSAGSAMHRIKETDAPRVTETFGRSEVAVEKETEEERFRVAGTVQSLADGIDIAVVMASIATQMLQ